MVKHTTIWMTCFCIASLSAVIWPVLPHPLLLTVCWLLLVGCHVLLRQSKWYRYFVPVRQRNSLLPEYLLWAMIAFNGFLTGCIWGASLGYWYISWQQPTEKFQQDVILPVAVEQVRPAHSTTQCILTVALITHSQHYPHTAALDTKLIAGWHNFWLTPKARLYWYAAQPCPTPGQRLLVRARLRPLTFLRNPGGPDSGRQYIAQRIVATGYVKSLLQQLPASAASLHQRISQAIRQLAMPNQRWTLALLTGDRSQLTDTDWQSLQHTGTAHLFSISGMHLALIAGWAILIASYCILPLVSLFTRGRAQPPLRGALIFITWLICVAYTALANWQLPVCRALLLLTVAGLCYLRAAFIRHTDMALIMLCVCCVVFPFAVYGSGLYLSIGAVMVIWLVHWRIRPNLTSLMARWRWFMLLQAWLTVCLLPLTLGFFDTFSATAPLINLLVIPIIGLLLPLGMGALLVLVLSNGAWSQPLRVFDQTLGGLTTGLQNVASALPLATVSLSWLSLVALFVAILLLLAPAFSTKRWCIGILLMPVLSQFLPFNPRYWYLHVLDVGQGTALVFSQGARAILVDTGPAYPGAASAFERHIQPALRTLNLTSLDAVYISHGDNDHAGGVPQALAYASAGQALSSVAGCQQGYHVQWQQLTLTALWPQAANNIDDNNHSCVLLVGDGINHVLAPGDIEKQGEYGMLYHSAIRPVDVLIAPHHGSASSSGALFVERFKPDYVVFTTARFNRWGFPAPSVTKRYAQVGSQQLNTAVGGYTRFRFSEDDAVSVLSYQQQHPRWYYRPLQ
ncbi:DNA internalization-related competence protein ComEC/Rec2 [Salinimonas sediminis]|uniref:DNA internalization-related competence protein ComEC/Rec2 n=2 Tax=Salinimonas sediminis TaxID=2303538 RepID=A0A346NLQ7_9ALTE|nr:DNA internalization-related competence protein ComEC/Rec2 [Salinimonas sediminis]